MQIQNWLQDAIELLKMADIGTPRLDALVLLEDSLTYDRGWILAHPEHRLTTAQTTTLAFLLSRRATHEPLAYIRGHVEFYGRSFTVGPGVMVPRPESEAMIELLLALSTDHLDWQIADVGTGSGALGITAALELPNSIVTLLEISPAAATIARTNVINLSTGARVLQSDLLSATTDAYDVLLCNLPYVPDDYSINKAAAHEPQLALFGGPDGLDLYRKLFNQISSREFQPLYILTEALPMSHTLLSDIAEQSGYELAQTKDFIQVFMQK